MNTTVAKKILGKRIRANRLGNKLNRKKLAAMVNMDRGYLAGIENGKQNPSFSKLLKLACALDASLSDWMKDL